MAVHDWQELSAQRDALVVAMRDLADRLERAKTVDELDRLTRFPREWSPIPPSSARKVA